MEAQTIINLLNNSEIEYSKFPTKKWYVINSDSKGNYLHENPIKYLTNSLESSLCDYSNAYILVTGDIRATPNGATQVILKNCAPFEKCMNKVTIILILQEVYGNFKKMK